MLLFLARRDIVYIVIKFSGVSDLQAANIPVFLLICWSSLQQAV